MKKKVISMFLTACTVSVMVVGGGSNLVMADDAETVTLMGWYDEDDMNPILEKVNEQMDGKLETGISMLDSFKGCAFKNKSKIIACFT